MQGLNNLKNKKIFISGGAGVIGKELVQKLLRLNSIIMVGDKKKCPKIFRGKVKYIQKDLNLLKSIELKNFKPEVFIHLAATYERTEENKNFFQNNFQNNVRLSNHLLQIIFKTFTVKKIIFASSYLVYSSDQYLKLKSTKTCKLNERSILNPRNLIGASKLYHEYELKFLSKFRKDISINIVRIFRGYGLGSRDVISRWVRAAIKNKTLKVYGVNSAFDYIYSKDTAESIIRLVNTRDKFKKFNIGYGKAIKIKKVLEILNKNFKKIKMNTKNKKMILENSAADIKSLIKSTNFKPNFDIKRGIFEIVQYEKKRNR